ncbi:MAG: hypothetical protein JNM12_15480 [Alphaproteobacteria bacterium]|nr:hypothetical protein [Alphaproteobacteria bacterium]
MSETVSREERKRIASLCAKAFFVPFAQLAITGGLSLFLFFVGSGIIANSAFLLFSFAALSSPFWCLYYFSKIPLEKYIPNTFARFSIVALYLISMFVLLEVCSPEIPIL